jgi:DNA-binding transcriptional LysR family regulator
LLYGYARKLVLLKEETETAMAEFHGKIRGRLTVGGSTIPGAHVLPRVVGAFLKTYPEVTVSLVIGDAASIVARCAAGTLELGIVGAKTRDRQVRQDTLIEDEMCLVVPPDADWTRRPRITVPELLKMPFILREAGSGTLRSFERSLGRAGHALDDLSVVAEMGSSAAVIQGVKSGVGCSVVSRIAVTEDLTAGTLRAVAVAGLDLKRRFYLTTHRYKSPSPLLEPFVTFLKETLGDGMG